MRGPVSVCGTARTHRAKGAPYHFRAGPGRPYRRISPIMVAGSDRGMTQCKCARHDRHSVRLRACLLHHRAAPCPRQAGPGRGPGARRARPPHPGARRSRTHPPPADHGHRRARRGPGEGSRRRQAAPHDLRRPPPHGPARQEGARRGRQARQGHHGQPGVRRSRRDLRAVSGRLPAQLDRRRGPAAATRPCTTARATTTRSGTASRWCSATATARSSAASPSRVDVIGHELTHGVTEYDGGPRLPRPVRRAQRVDVRRLRLARQAVHPGPDRRRGRLADRRGPARPDASAAPRCAR